MGIGTFDFVANNQNSLSNLLVVQSVAVSLFLREESARQQVPKPLSRKYLRRKLSRSCFCQVKQLTKFVPASDHSTVVSFHTSDQLLADSFLALQAPATI